MINVEASELTQIKSMSGTFNREIAFDIDDDVIIVHNFVSRKQNQLLVIPTEVMLSVCHQTLIRYELGLTPNPFKEHLNQCATIVEDSAVREECIIN